MAHGCGSSGAKGPAAGTRHAGALPRYPTGRTGRTGPARPRPAAARPGAHAARNHVDVTATWLQPNPRNLREPYVPFPG